MENIERVELHLHTKMTKLDGIIDIENLIEIVNNLDMKAFAITDYASVQAFPQVQKYLEKTGYDIKPIYGMEVSLTENIKDAAKFNAVLLVRNQIGLKNLYKIITEANRDYNFQEDGILLKSILDKYREGLLVSSGVQNGELYQAILNKKSDEEIKNIVNYYDYLEVHSLGEKEINHRIVELGKELDKLVVATSNAYYMYPQYAEARNILKYANGLEVEENEAQKYFRITEEALDDFGYFNEDIASEIVVENTQKIADMCEKIELFPKGKFSPHIKDAEKEIEEKAYSRAYEIYGKDLPEGVKERLERELKYIKENDYATQYKIAEILVKKSNEKGYAVISRGCIVSSLVAYLIGITDINPLPAEYNGMNILVETLMGLDGKKEPDIVLNFSGEFQAEAHNIIIEMFGKDKVAKAGTIGTIFVKTALDYIEKYMKENAKSFSNGEVDSFVNSIYGVKRIEGQFPGGLIIIPNNMDFSDFTPLRYLRNTQNAITHYDYHFLDGMFLKYDLLASNIPTMLKQLKELTGIDPTTISLDDEETMTIFSADQGLELNDDNLEIGTIGVPEFESEFFRKILELTRPTTFEELVHISGLCHGSGTWRNNAEELIKSKTITLTETISTRDDVMIYLMKQGMPKEQAFEIMEIVRKGKADKSNPEWCESVASMMLEYKIPNWYIDSCEKINYLFPRAHACDCVKNAFRIAWYKVHKPKEFCEVYKKMNEV